ncbi:hypothetical protein ACFYUJ_21090 [Streptomyces sp. NPDC004520]|uniref:TRADD-N-associated membrane domain-containing protein n=1 Tax=Streptomyces sp. NPDC004520 TaxID=3364702 RepID=UPI0036BC2CB3
MQLSDWSNFASVFVVAMTTAAGAAGAAKFYRSTSSRLKNEAEEESKRLRDVVQRAPTVARVTVVGDSSISGTGSATSSGSGAVVVNKNTYTMEKGVRPPAGEQKVDDDRFAELLIEYYGWGLTQARRSTALSLTVSGVGIFVLLAGIAIGIWKAETSGDMYVSVVASVSGLVSTMIGHLAHRRADAAMVHMQEQTERLRQDMRRERETESAIRLAGEIDDPELRAELQAALVLKLSGGTLADVRSSVPVVPIPTQVGGTGGPTA